MKSTTSFGKAYGDAVERRTGQTLRVQECHRRRGRAISIRPGFADSDRFWRGLHVEPEMLPALITALQEALRHTEALQALEQGCGANG